MSTNPFTSGGPESGAIPAGTCCAHHGSVAARFRCQDCGTYLCEACDHALPDGVHVCSTCLGGRTRRVAGEVFAAPAPEARLKLRDRSGDRALPVFAPVTVAPALAQGNEPRCAQHPTAAALATCDTCQGLICATCMFEVPGGLHLCPHCALRARHPLSPGRLWSVIISLVLAVIGVAGFLAVMTGALADFVAADVSAVQLGILVALVWFLLPLAGMALSFGAMDRKLGNPPLVWVAAIANLLLVLSFVVMAMVGDGA